MKLPARSVALALPLFLAGCFLHRKHQVQNQELAAALRSKPPIGTTEVELPDSSTAIPLQPIQAAETPAEELPRPRVHRRKPEDKNPEEAVNAAPEGVSAIGQLSSGDPADYRQQTLESINSIERGLNGITRKLSAPEQKTADHIREFLKEARAALASGDVDGAHTLAVKAKVLLEELTK